MILELGTGDTFFVDVDPATGAWGGVFSASADFFDAYAHCARSPPEFQVAHASDALTGAAGAGPEEDFFTRFPCEELWRQDVGHTGTRVSELRGTNDPGSARRWPASRTARSSPACAP